MAQFEVTLARVVRQTAKVTVNVKPTFKGDYPEFDWVEEAINEAQRAVDWESDLVSTSDELSDIEVEGVE